MPLRIVLAPAGLASDAKKQMMSGLEFSVPEVSRLIRPRRVRWFRDNWRAAKLAG